MFGRNRWRNFLKMKKYWKDFRFSKRIVREISRRISRWISKAIIGRISEKSIEEEVSKFWLSKYIARGILKRFVEDFPNEYPERFLNKSVEEAHKRFSCWNLWQIAGGMAIYGKCCKAKHFSENFKINHWKNCFWYSL